MYLQRCFERYVDEIFGAQETADIARRYTDSNNELKKKLISLKRQDAEQSKIIENVELFFSRLDELGSCEIDHKNVESLIERIEVYEGEMVAGKREKYNKIDVYFIGVGLLKD